MLEILKNSNQISDWQSITAKYSKIDYKLQFERASDMGVFESRK